MRFDGGEGSWDLSGSPLGRVLTPKRNHHPTQTLFPKTAEGGAGALRHLAQLRREGHGPRAGHLRGAAAAVICDWMGPTELI